MVTCKQLLQIELRKWTSVRPCLKGVTFKQNKAGSGGALVLAAWARATLAGRCSLNPA